MALILRRLVRKKIRPEFIQILTSLAEIIYFIDFIIFLQGSKEYQVKKEQVDRFTQDSMKRLCEILDVEKKGSKVSYS